MKNQKQALQKSISFDNNSKFFHISDLKDKHNISRSEQ